MKSLILLLICSTLFFGCKDDENPAPENETCEIINTNGTVLKNLFFENAHTTLSSNTWTFYYTNSGQIDSIGPSHPQQTAQKYHYVSERLVKIDHTEEFDSTFFNCDSFIYDNTNRISERLIYHKVFGGNLVLNRTLKYFYNEFDQIKSIQRRSHPNEEVTRIDEFEWENNNLISWVASNVEEEILFEYEYEYGTKLNIWKTIPYFVETPYLLSESNCVKIKNYDYADPTTDCTPCINDLSDNHSYNLDDYIVEERPDLGGNLSRIEYIYE